MIALDDLDAMADTLAELARLAEKAWTARLMREDEREAMGEYRRIMA